MKNQIYIVIGLGYGDEGKGTIVDYLTQLCHLKGAVRFNGGSQAAHHVVHEELWHCFAQFGSCILVKGTQTFHSSHMLINPITLEVENQVLQEKGITDALERLTISEDCHVITPFNVWINRMTEISRGDSRHGSCGMGIGETVRDGFSLGDRALYIKDLLDLEVLFRKLDFLYLFKLSQAEQLAEGRPELEEYLDKMRWVDIDALAERYHELASKINIVPSAQLIDTVQKGNVVFEGAQGVLLDTEHGFVPHTTWSRTTFQNADQLIQGQDACRIGAIRAYMTRHGNGPFVTEDDLPVTPCHNHDNEWQGSFRNGWFDLVAMRYALSKVPSINAIALTNLDRLSGIEEINVCTYYQFKGALLESLPQLKGEELTPVVSCCKPVYNYLPGWDEDISQVKCFSKLPENAQNYVLYLEKALGVPITIISVGPKPEQKFERR